MKIAPVLGGLVAAALVVPALAQSNPPAATPATPPAAAASAPASQVTAGSVWRATKLNGLDVYNDQNEKLGDISEILIDKSGKVAGVVIGVGGFLGLGQHDIMVEMSKLKFVDEPVKTSSTTTTPTTTGAATSRPAATTTTASKSADHKWYPDHAILSGATKDSLKNMTQFKYD